MAWNWLCFLHVTSDSGALLQLHEGRHPRIRIPSMVGRQIHDLSKESLIRRNGGGRSMGKGALMLFFPPSNAWCPSPKYIKSGFHLLLNASALLHFSQGSFYSSVFARHAKPGAMKLQSFGRPFKSHNQSFSEPVWWSREGVELGKVRARFESIWRYRKSLGDFGSNISTQPNS